MDGHPELPLARKATPQPVAPSVIHACKDLLAALNLQINISGLDDKELYLPLAIDAAHWSRIRKGDAHFPLNKLNDLCELTGNEIALQWWAHSRRQGLHMLETEAEHLLRLERDKTARLERDNEVLVNALHGKRAAV
jgi:hypothetical protein